MVHNISALLEEHLFTPLDGLWHPNLCPFPIIATLHALRVALLIRKSLSEKGENLPFLQGLFALLVMSLGGTTLTAFLLGSSPTWLASNVVLPTYSLVYIAVFYSPGDVIYKVLGPLHSILDLFLIFPDALARTSAVTTAGVDNIRFNQQRPLSDSIVAAVLCGTLAASGGGIVAESMSLTSKSWKLRTPSVLRKPLADVQAAFFGSWLYLLTTNPELLHRFIAFVNSLVGDSKGIPNFVLVSLPKEDARTVTFLLIAFFLYWKNLSQFLFQTVVVVPAVSGPKKKTN